MGGFFSAPSTPAPPSLPASPDPEAEARELRLENMARNRRGRAGMISTSERGVLNTSGRSVLSTSGRSVLSTSERGGVLAPTGSAPIGSGAAGVAGKRLLGE